MSCWSMLHPTQKEIGFHVKQEQEATTMLSRHFAALGSLWGPCQPPGAREPRLNSPRGPCKALGNPFGGPCKAPTKTVLGPGGRPKTAWEPCNRDTQYQHHYKSDPNGVSFVPRPGQHHLVSDPNGVSFVPRPSQHHLVSDPNGVSCSQGAAQPWF